LAQKETENEPGLGQLGVTYDRSDALVSKKLLGKKACVGKKKDDFRQQAKCLIKEESHRRNPSGDVSCTKEFPKQTA